MSRRDIILRATQRASEVLDSCGALQRIEQGYTRIDPFQVAAQHGILVMLRPMEKLLGAFVGDTNPGILVNNQRPAGLVHMTCAHELGHYFMGHESTADKDIYYANNAAVVELEADEFGFSLLAPRKLISSVMKRKGWQKTDLWQPVVLYQMALRLGTSYKAMAWSLVRHQVFSTVDAEKLLRIQPAAIKKALLGMPLTDADKDVWLLDESDKESILEPRPDDQIVVRLKSNASAGYLWQTDGLNDAEEEGFNLQPITVPSRNEPDDPLVFGGPSTMDYVLTGGRTLRTSPTELQLAERMPWLSEGKALNRFSSKAKFEGLETGFTTYSRAQLLEASAS
ncbi:ImmA/IrrE family metallo-endopeptidase [Pseudomonas aeruginosa]|uniref:ImmA/IrrE family metallo-endopeptidase n=1 Tax=Pseudomonas aeruginosa TaxID=287 RepID=UPI00071B9401|nr:ImmA/IrrE family metallo-endopeptidase [Pseudomonas aeruginosa]KSC59629.1 hypothetical protein AO887_08955 [Pseudomonas aeruginosa]MDP5489378.1 ImmA/IrrE family metallo-endopeptidase [Pseudomonas aeruginosa]MDV7940170.1 ImmA/IrrE family metallo-endopeptidase [Pseudomonas aeruginosa]HEC1609932.1 ImmA/IrrE family metallo-endopeptidase [Pseudomonas aeruginosa]HEJ4488762.1 ImmA/IrrE family metallo-endopeptidase [Pseudomonas aeruginosa]